MVGKLVGGAAYGRGSGSTPGMPASMSCRYRLIQQPSGMSPIVKLSPPAQHQPHLRPSDSRRPDEAKQTKGIVDQLATDMMTMQANLKAAIDQQNDFLKTVEDNVAKRLF